MSDKIVYLMRGLPSCGKSTTAKKLVGETGLLCETDEYFYSQVGDDPASFDWDDDLADAAREWDLQRFKQAVDAGRSPIVVDRGNSLSLNTKMYATYAHERGYRVELAEPDSPWWLELRVLLKYKPYTVPVLKKWAQKLSEVSLHMHRVPQEEIWHRMDKWKWDLTVEEILNYQPRHLRRKPKQ